MKHLILYEIASLIFLVATLYLTVGSLTEQTIDILIMYALFMFGTLGYLRPLFHPKSGRRKEDKKG